VFPDRNGKHQQNLSKTFYRVVIDLGLNEIKTKDPITGEEVIRQEKDTRRRVCFHSLRHSCASFMVSAGVELYQVGQILGHKTPTLTSRYSHLHPNTVKRAINCIPDLDKPDNKSNSANKVVQLFKE
jgi:integrase